jgi:hypothetical protein
VRRRHCLHICREVRPVREEGRLRDVADSLSRLGGLRRTSTPSTSAVPDVIRVAVASAPITRDLPAPLHPAVRRTRPL